jgi:F-type H+-transporting ATPase subunit b
MSLLTPDIGLLFWMLLSFGIVFALLAKFGFPVITRMVDERREYITQSLAKAEEANRALAEMTQKADALMAEARKSQSDLIKQATAEAAKIIQQAKDDAVTEGQQKLNEALRMIELQKQRAAGELRAQVAQLSVDVAEKILRRELDNPDAHGKLVATLLDEIENDPFLRN